MKKLIPFVLCAAACAYKPSAELTRAQEAYRQAANGSTSDVAPAELHQAKVALDNAAAADRSDPGSEEAKDLSYVAERKAQWAQAQASIKIAHRNKTDAEKRLVNDQGTMLVQQQKQIRDNSTALSQKDRELMDANKSTAEAQALAAAAAQREQEAAQREKDALAKLKAAEDERGQVITLPSGLMFKTNQSILLAAARPKLDEVAEALKKMPNKTVLIEGHTDSVGSEDKNLELSDRRAKAVKDYLVSKGVPDEKVRTQGAGKSRPVADNATTEGRALNRRVEIVIQNSSESSAKR